MPTNEKILGFSNYWYPEAIMHSISQSLADGTTVRIVSPVYFLATKIAAFEHRGRNDFLGSRDMEDIVTVIDGRQEIASEVAAANQGVRAFIAEKFSNYLQRDAFHDCIYGHLLPDTVSQARAPIVTRRVSQMAGVQST